MEIEKADRIVDKVLGYRYEEWDAIYKSIQAQAARLRKMRDQAAEAHAWSEWRKYFGESKKIPLGEGEIGLVEMNCDEISPYALLKGVTGEEVMFILRVSMFGTFNHEDAIHGIVTEENELAMGSGSYEAGDFLACPDGTTYTVEDSYPTGLIQVWPFEHLLKNEILVLFYHPINVSHPQK